MIPFPNLMATRRGMDFVPPKRLLVLDPGETTGWALFEDGKLSTAGQLGTKQEGWIAIHSLFHHIQPNMVVYENYRVYQHKLERHSNSEVYTVRLIGVIEFLCEIIHGIPHYNQMAHEAKGFVSDDKLQKWGYYKPGLKHARDAIRHGCYFLLFNKNLK
jgi:hypothetical protein